MAIQLRSNDESVRGQSRLDSVDDFKNKTGAVFETSPVLKTYVRW